MHQRQIAVITKLSMVNIGNQALSNEFMHLIKRSCNQHKIAFLGRPPEYSPYTTKELEQAGSKAFELFETWTDKMLEDCLASPSHQLEIAWNEIPAVRVNRPPKTSASWLALREFLRIRSRLTKLNPSKAIEQSRRRLNFYKSTDLVLYNPAGEMHSERDAFDTPLRQLLELRVAQKMGARIGVANHSIEVQGDVLLAFLGKVYLQFDLIIVRDTYSKQVLINAGVPEARIQILPDMAFLANPGKGDNQAAALSKEGIEPNTVVITVNHRTNESSLLQWDSIIENLQQRGKTVFFMSNALAQDLVMANRFQRRYGIRVLSYQYDYPEYIKLLTQVELVITNRLHTGVFSLIANTPIIPVEPRSHRIQGVFDLMDYPIKAIHQNRAGWGEEAISQIDYIYDNYTSLKQTIHEQVQGTRKVIEEGFQKNLQQLLESS